MPACSIWRCPGDLTGNYFHSFLKGFLEEADRWRTPLLGGDLSNSEKVYVSITAWGSFKEDRHPVYRSGGQVDDTLILIGDVGFSRLGLEILQQEDPDRLWEITDEETLASWSGDAFRFRCLKAHLLPSPLIPVGIWLCENGLANSMIDVSDGLATDLLHLACESQVEAEIQIDRLVLPEHNINQLSALEAALNGGEDYALLLSASPEQVERLSATYPSHFPPSSNDRKIVAGQACCLPQAKGRTTTLRTERVRPLQMKFIRTTPRSLLLIRETPEKTALAFSVGVFCGFSPFMGFHTILGLVAAIAFRLNKTAVLIGVFMNSPWLLAPYYTFATWFGVQLMGLPAGVSLAEIGLSDVLGAEFWYSIASQWRLLIPAFVGSFLLSIILSLLGYGLALFLIRRTFPSSLDDA